MDEVIEEYLYYKTASSLGIGPKIEKIFGFDIICYNNVI